MKIRKSIRSSIRIGELSIPNGIDENGIDNNMDSDLRVILRKLSKKDSTTKIRVNSHRLCSSIFNVLNSFQGF